MSQSVFISFKKKIFTSADPTIPIAAGDTVLVRLEETCGSCPAVISGPNVSATAIGCGVGDNRQTIEANNAYILAKETGPTPCVGAVVPLVVEAVSHDGRGFSFDRAAAGQHYRASDIDQVQPDHNGVACA
tara:strand:- start:682 stop:1074 length:393 start_codon:yes stop_codon:yes gene_type:complete